MGKKERMQAVGRVGGKAKGGSAKAGKASSFSRSKGNAFDVQKNSRSKYEVLGKRVKGQGRNVAQARAQAEERRRQTLLKQFQSRKKNNEFKDRRLGEQSADMSLEDKMLARFQTERKKQYQQQRNASKFNLNEDDDRDEEFLTHRGQKIDDYDNFDGPEGSDMDEEDRAFENKLGREMVNQLHFGGGAADAADEPAKKKTHEEIMHEVMMKSKMYKAEKQKNKATQDETTEVLDAEFADFQKMLSFRPKKADRTPEARGELDEFDKMARLLSLEAKAKASERKLTPEEIAKKEHEKLAELEKQRVARMNGEDDSDAEAPAKAKKGGKKQPKFILMRPPPATDDALTDDYEIDQQFNQDNASDDDEEGDDARDGEGDDGDDDDDDDDLEEDDEEDAEDDDAMEDENDDEDEDEEVDEEALARAQKKREDAAKEIPYVLECPTTPAELAELFTQYGRTAEDRNTIVDRLRKYYSPKLSAANQALTKKLLAVLVRQYLKYAANYDRHGADLAHLAVHIFHAAQDLPDAAGALFRDYLAALQKKLEKKKTVGWPDMRDLLLFRVALNVFPATDLRHNVVTPIELLVGQALAKAPVASVADVRAALFCVGLSLHATKGKRKFAPEAVHALTTLVALLADADSDWWRDAVAAWVAEHPEDAFPAVPLHTPLGNEAMSAALFHGTLTLVEAAATQYAALPSVHELFHPIERLLVALKKRLPKSNGRVEKTIAHLRATSTASLETRKPLRLQTFAPTVLPTFVPKFDENYAMRKDKTADRDKAQLKQLQRQVKRERKGASRELRRDAAFLARQRQEEHASWQKEKGEKQREIRAWMEQQNATFNQQVRKGGGLLKGGGAGLAKKARVSKK
ncbi:nucleolar protein [Achlya hypogyna]|uniref:Nucleolar protein n=1 Tax=Achlya hypogyna TaxID=1202772 RepID=A0A1V9YAH9_ACHHY|nr:nucleolar protein [Achlya hypogyna]